MCFERKECNNLINNLSVTIRDFINSVAALDSFLMAEFKLLNLFQT